MWYNVDVQVSRRERQMGKRSQKAKKLIRAKLADTTFEETPHYSKRYAATVLSVASVVICIAALIGALWLSEDNIARLKDFAAEHWLAGSLIFMGICILQVVIALIPGEAVEVAAGVIFGSVGGTVVCLIGATLGSVIVLVLVRRFGRKFVESLYPREKIDSLPILRDPKKRNATIFLLFLIPGTPKDLITYIIGLTEVSVPMYILLTTIARIPSIAMSTVGGDAFSEGKLMEAVVIFAIAAVVSGAGYLTYLIVQRKWKKKHDEKKNENGDR